MNKEVYDVVIVGGGLAGLTAATYLAKHGKKVILLERGEIGGRAMSIDVQGFSFNYGLRSFYGRDVSTISKLEKELKLDIAWEEYNSKTSKYDMGFDMSVIPATIKDLIETKMLGGANKLRYAWLVLKTLVGFETGNPNQSMGEWIKSKELNEELKEMILTLASSNFFTNEPEKIPSDVFFAFYKKMFKTKKPISYIVGGGRSLVDEFARNIELYEGEIRENTKVVAIEETKGIIKAVHTEEGIYYASHFIFAVPPTQLARLFIGSAIEREISHHINKKPTHIMFYDVGLKNKLNSQLTYVYDKDKKIFIVDVSAHDQYCVPGGGQLLQCVAYLNEEESNNPESFDYYKREIEKLYDRHFSGWRDELVVPRISKKTVVQEIKWTTKQQGMPTHFPRLGNVYFAGDWCQGSGQLSELSLSSAYEVSKKIILDK